MCHQTTGFSEGTGIIWNKSPRRPAGAVPAPVRDPGRELDPPCARKGPPWRADRVHLRTRCVLYARMGTPGRAPGHGRARGRRRGASGGITSNYRRDLR